MADENQEKPCLSDEWIANFLRRFNQGIITPSEARDELVKITDELIDIARRSNAK